MKKIFDRDFARICKFLLVGVLGVFFHLGMMYALTEIAGVFYILSAILSGLLNLVLNYFVNNYWTFSDRKNGSHFLGLGKFSFVTILDVAIYYGVLISLTEVFGVFYLLSSLIATLVRFPIKYFFCWNWVFPK